jgi:hypothetical protein
VLKIGLVEERTAQVGGTQVGPALKGYITSITSTTTESNHTDDYLCVFSRAFLFIWQDLSTASMTSSI